MRKFYINTCGSKSKLTYEIITLKEIYCSIYKHNLSISEEDTINQENEKLSQIFLEKTYLYAARDIKPIDPAFSLIIKISQIIKSKDSYAINIATILLCLCTIKIGKTTYSLISIKKI